MRPEDIPYGDRILPTEKCEKCGSPLVIIEEAGDEEDTVYIGCPDSGGVGGGHTEHNGQPRKHLLAWGWMI